MLIAVAAIAAAIVAVVACEEQTAGGGGGIQAQAGGAVSEPARAAYRDHPGGKPVELVDAVGLSLRAGCRSYGKPQAYLQLAAATDLEDVKIRVRFQTDRFGEEEIYRFSPDGFSSEYGRWDVMGGEPSHVSGILSYRTANDESVRVRFRGRGGQGRRPCRLFTSTVVASGEKAAEVQPTARPDVPVSRGWVPRPVILGPQGGQLRPCEVGPRGGGYELWIKDISCAHANAWLRRLGGVVGLQASPSGEGGYGRFEGGWECWSKLERRLGPFHNLCVRDDQLVMFYFA